MGRNQFKVIRTKIRMEERAKCRAKRVYLAFDAAVAESRSIARRMSLRHPPTAYVCGVCGNYHLTSSR